MSKAFQQVHLSSWAKGSLGNFLGHVNALAALAPHRLVDEFNRLFRKAGVKKDMGERDSVTEKPKALGVTTPDSIRDTSLSKSALDRLKSQVENEREQHTFEKAVEDTNQSITSYFSHFKSTRYMPVAPSTSTQIDAKEQKQIKEVKVAVKPAEEEAGWNVFRRLPLPFLNSEEKSTKKAFIRKDYVARSAIDARTRAIVASIKTASSYESKIIRVRDLGKHLKLYPSGRHEATECKIIPLLLPMTQSTVKELREEAMEALVLLGYNPPVKGRGIRILSLDGGGTRGLMTIQCLRKMEEISKRPIYELFDYVCGVSTGALIACMACLYRLPLDHCEKLYLEFSKQMFSRSRFIGTGGLVWNHAFYDSDQWEKILQTQIGSKALIEFSRDSLVPKMSAISTVMNTPRLKNFVFRNYNLPPNAYSAYPGSCTHMVWEVVRASSAAPGYYEDFLSGDYVHSDGGLSVNNPTAVAIHESRLIWPNETIQCVVSLGTGRYEPVVQMTGGSKVSLKEKVSKIVDSATDTEAVHVMLSDLMPPSTYFRFNPYLSEDLQLDEIRQDRIDCMIRDTAMYLRKNETKMAKAVHTLKLSRLPHQVALDWVRYKVDCNI